MTSTIAAVPAQRGPAQRGPMALAPYTGPTDFEGQRAMAEFWATAGPTVPPLYRGRPGDVFNAIMTGVAFDLHPSTVMHHFFYDTGTGRGGMSASLMHGLLNRAGHTLRPLESTGTVCRMELVRGDDRPGGTVSWKLSEAVSAGIADSMFRNYAADSLWARCTSRACRRFAPEVVVGYAYSLEELGSVVPDPEDEDQVETERPVSERVQEFLEPLDGAGHAAIVDAYKQATSKVKAFKGLDTEYAGVFDGQEMTVGQVLQRWGLEAANREALARRAEQVDQSTAAVVAGRQEATGAAEPESQPAGDGLGDVNDPTTRRECGCLQAAYILHGGHFGDDCTVLAGQRTAAELATEPAIEVAGSEPAGAAE